MPKKITVLEENVLRGCKSLEEITIPESVTKIEDSAFNYCHKLKSITIPQNVTSIGEKAFDMCIWLGSVVFENPDGWYVIEAKGSDVREYLSTAVAKDNATRLKKDYVKYYWYRE